jgi:hypothetical protein
MFVSSIAISVSAMKTLLRISFTLALIGVLGGCVYDPGYVRYEGDRGGTYYRGGYDNSPYYDDDYSPGYYGYSPGYYGYGYGYGYPSIGFGLGYYGRGHGYGYGHGSYGHGYGGHGYGGHGGGNVGPRGNGNPGGHSGPTRGTPPSGGHHR